MKTETSKKLLLMGLLTAGLLAAGCGDDDGCQQCADTEFTCDNGECVDSAARCDGVDDCADGSDEVGCSCDSTTELTCDNGECVDAAARCDGVDDCADGSDEVGCQCDSTAEFTCDNGDCVDATAVCDGTDDCADGSDEASCCTDTCPTADDTRCDGSVIEVCALDEDGCVHWVTVTDCAVNRLTCDDTAEAVCVVDCTLTGPPAPSNPTPADATDLIDSQAVDTLDWDNVPGAVSYAYYVGTDCPPPAYPDPAYISVTASEATGMDLLQKRTYCWQVVATDPYQCVSQSPVWNFYTDCIEVSGAPQVLGSRDRVLPTGTASGIITLEFNEPVENVAANVTWTAVTGSGTMLGVTRIDFSTYEVAYTGMADGDEYTITVGDGVTDTCGTPLLMTTDIRLRVSCPLVTGDYIINMHDSYGDGWQTTTSGGGPGVTVTLDSSQVIEFGLCTPYQSSSFPCVPDNNNGSTTITIPAGTTTADWYFPGDFWGEISFEIITPDGILATEWQAGSPAGPFNPYYCN